MTDEPIIHKDIDKGRCIYGRCLMKERIRYSVYETHVFALGKALFEIRIPEGRRHFLITCIYLRNDCDIQASFSLSAEMLKDRQFDGELFIDISLWSKMRFSSAEIYEFSVLGNQAFNELKKKV